MRAVGGPKNLLFYLYKLLYNLLNLDYLTSRGSATTARFLVFAPQGPQAISGTNHTTTFFVGNPLPQGLCKFGPAARFQRQLVE